MIKYDRVSHKASLHTLLYNVGGRREGDVRKGMLLTSMKRIHSKLSCTGAVNPS